MKITCQSCQSKYTVSDEKVQGKTVKIKCRKCGATIIVNSAGASQVNGGAADPISTTGGDGSYLVNVTEGDQRTMTIDELMAAYNSGVVTAETYIWSDGMADWQPLGQVDAVVAALNAASPAEPEAAPAAAVEPAPRAAAVRRDPMRRSQDLFGGGMSAQTAHDDVATSAPLFQAPVAPSPMTGQREENSTLFSLSALTAKAAVGSSPSRTTATKEDSGLIDLKALAEAGPVAPPVNLMPDHGGLFPLGAPIVASPASVHPGAPGSIPAPGKKSPVFIIVGGVVALFAIVGVFMVVKGGGEKPVPSAEPVATGAATAAPPTATAAPTAAPTATASASAEASSDASSAPSAKAKAGGRGRGNAGKGAPAAAAAPAAAPPAAAKPGKGNCGCAAGDLMCAMKCSAH